MQSDPKSAAATDGDVGHKQPTLMPLSEISAVLLDADGVILDTPHAIAWKKATDLARGWFASSSTRPFTEHFYVERVAGQSRERGAAAVLDLLEIPATADLTARVSAAKQAVFREEIAAGNSRLFSDAIPLIAQLQESGLRVAVVTASRNAEKLLGWHLSGRPDVRAFIDSVTAPVDGHDAPSKHDLVVTALESMGIEAGRTVYVDDSLDALASLTDLELRLVHLDRSGDAAAGGEGIVIRSLADLRLKADHLYFHSGDAHKSCRCCL